MLWVLAGCSTQPSTTVLSGEDSVGTSDAGVVVTGVTTSLESVPEKLTLPRFSYPTWIDEDSVLYESQVTGNWEIWSMSLDGLQDGGGDLRQVTDNDHLDRMPAMSPDRKSIVFISDRDGDYEVLRMNSDGSGVEQLTFNEVPEIHPYWSPDGSEIIYNRRIGSERLYEIRMMNSDGTNDRSLRRWTAGRGRAAGEWRDPEREVVVHRRNGCAARVSSSRRPG